MKRSSAAWALAGVVAGFAGIAVDYAVTEGANQASAIEAVAVFVRDHAPADLVNWARENHGKAITIPAIVVLLALFFGAVGRLARRRWWLGVLGFAVISAVGGAAVLAGNGATVAYLLPVALGFAVMTVAMALLGERLTRLQAVDDDDVFGEAWRGHRRDFLVVVGAVLGVAAVSTLVGRYLGRDEKAVEAEQEQLRLPVTPPVVPDGVRVEVDGVQPWMTPADDFYLIDTVFSKPAILAKEWKLRIHGMVEREIELTYNDLVTRAGVEAWITLNCVSNEIGGDLIGNAWWSGALLAPIIAEAGPLPGADCIKQTSHDGWDCATPLDTITDGRQAMLAIAMNGEPLPIEHGYPVRTIVPGLYGYVSATKWVVDMEITRFDDVEAYWTQRGWGELGPVKMASKIEVPANDDEVAAGEVVVAGTAWHQHTGIEGVEVQLDGGPWTPAELARVPNTDTWVQWRVALDVEPGDHQVTVRATDQAGEVQTSVRADVLPDGATGWHSVEFTAS
ncbi:molybdopterin-dependent oxidoreductase [Nocardioides sp. C4-1]|uniref:molybdopterin-dependent oxidoreductase n=1 Tax=Nocardioides sp. C4-1 TaxID=3151851 RepID=UPI0032646C35